MKNIISLLALMVVSSVCLTFVSCGDDDDTIYNKDEGKDNKTDFAVTGGVLDLGATYAKVAGYVNVEGAMTAVIQDVGVEWSYTSDFSEGVHKVSANGLVGSREFSVDLTDLAVSHTYYYRTYVYTGIYNYGKTLSFTTKAIPDVGNVLSIKEVSLVDARFLLNFSNNLNKLEDFDIFLLYSTNRDDVAKGGGEDVRLSARDEEVIIEGLKPGTTYYYALYYSSTTTNYKLGEIKSFTTKSSSNYLQTLGAKEVSMSSAVIEGNTTLETIYPYENIEYGFLFSDDIADIISEDDYYNVSNDVIYKLAKIDIDNFGYNLHCGPLSAGQTYYYCAYAYIPSKEGFIKGSIRNFTTKDIQHTGLVDLGLSVKWHSCDLGSSSPEVNGNYYAWGELSTKTSFSTSTYKYYNSTTKEYTYLSSEISGNVNYDAATKELGLRLPTQKECEELIEKCSWETFKYNGVSGLLVTGPNGNSIFINVSGGYKKVSSAYASSGKYYWTGSEYNDQKAYALKLGSNQTVSSSYRYYGMRIRPVGL